MSKIPESIWRKAERNMIERERIRLIENGTIKPKDSAKKGARK